MRSAGCLSAIPSATGGIARLACARVAESGKDPAALLSKAGLTLNDFSDPAVRLEVSTQIMLLELAAIELEDDILGFRLARGFDLRQIGLVYYVLASSENVADALRAAERYSRIMNEGVRLRFNMEGHTATIALEYVGVDRMGDRQQIEFWIVTLVRICRQVTDGRLVPSRLQVRHLRAGMPPNLECSLAGTSSSARTAMLSLFRCQWHCSRWSAATAICTICCDVMRMKPWYGKRRMARRSVQKSRRRLPRCYLTVEASRRKSRGSWD